MTNIRKTELLEQVMSYLIDNDLLEDFCEDRNIEFSDEEKEYFEIEESDGDEEWD